MKIQHWLPVIAVVLATLTSSAQAQLLINGSFESPVVHIAAHCPAREH